MGGGSRGEDQACDQGNHGSHRLRRAELVADCFELARRVRSLDMRASPYDVTSLGLEPVRIETAQGREDYALQQRHFATEAAALRVRLLEAVS